MSISLGGLNTQIAAKLPLSGGAVTGSLSSSFTFTATTIGNVSSVLYGSAAALTGIITGPTITSVTITNSGGTDIDDTSVSTAGGSYVKIIGSGFGAGAVVLVGTVAATSTTVQSSTQILAQLAASTSGTRDIFIVNTDGTAAVKPLAVTFSAFPAWSTSATLTDVDKTVSFSQTLSAPSDSAVTYTLNAGSTLPAGTALTTGGVLSGAITDTTTVSTTYSFTVQATDVEYQNIPRTFSLFASSFFYFFDSHTFTSAGVDGPNGPTLAQCRTSYSSASWELDTSLFNVVTQGVQLWTVPQRGLYAIEVSGARGGAHVGGGSYGSGSSGRKLSAQFTLSAGDILAIVVGQPGANCATNTGITDYARAAGGGGGSFVFCNSVLYMAAAGGGGGSRDGYASANGTYATSGSGGSTGGTGDANPGAAGGGGGSSGNGGLGGFNTSVTSRTATSGGQCIGGVSGGTTGGGGGGGGTGGSAASSSFVGGAPSGTNSAVGGFGGGASSGGTNAGGTLGGGGGGGGGNGGGGGGGATKDIQRNSGQGGGGGSYILGSGTSQTDLGASTTAYVTITYNP
jgi:hypothetical protein